MQLPRWLTSLLHMTPRLRARRRAIWRNSDPSRHSAAWVEVLEDRTMLSGSTGLIPEGSPSQSDDTSPELVIDQNLVWSTYFGGREWVAPDLSGDWRYGGGIPRVTQVGSELTFINEHGSFSHGRFDSPTRVFAIAWNLGGTVGNDGATIWWDNDTTWGKKPDAPVGNPDLSGDWQYGGGIPRVTQVGSELTFINDHGSFSHGRFDSPTRVFAIAWDLGGTIGNDGATIWWDNDTTWEKIPDAPVGFYTNAGEFNQAAGSPDESIDFETFGDGSSLPPPDENLVFPVDGDKWSNQGVVFTATDLGFILHLKKEAKSATSGIHALYTQRIDGAYGYGLGFNVFFASPVSSVGFTLNDIHLATSNVYVEFYGMTDQLIGHFDGVPVGGTSSTFFLGFVSQDPIKRVLVGKAVNADLVGFDNLRFTTFDTARVDNRTVIGRRRE